MEISKIYLIRHGDTIATETHLVYGAVDFPLSELGFSQVAKFRDAGQYPEIDEDTLVYCTPLTRTHQTLETIYGDVPHQVVEDLAELRFGEYESTYYPEVKDDENFKKWFFMEDPTLVPGPHPEGYVGESFMNFAERTFRGFKYVQDKHMLKALSLRHQKKPALSVIVCHGGVISSIMGQLFPEEEKKMFQWFPTPGGMYALSYDGAELLGYERVDEPERNPFKDIYKSE